MQVEKAEIEERLGKLRSGSLKPVSLEEKAMVDAEMKAVGMCVERRARIVREMWGVIAEMVPKEQWEDMKENLGVEV
jgi:26S proteasome regulatory subunit (ATPase 3-interacting protein)